jgi:hypothetical protein
MYAETIGIDKIEKMYLDKYDFQQIVFKKGSQVVYTKKIKGDETQEDLKNDFLDFLEDLNIPDNFKVYKLELFGSYNPNASKLSLVVSPFVALNNKESVGAYPTKKENASTINDMEKMLNLVEQNARLEMQLERLEEKLNEQLEEEEEEENPQAQSIGEAIQSTLIGKLDTIVDVILTRLAMPQQTIPQHHAINGVSNIETIITEFQTINPNIENDLAKLLHIAKTNPNLFNMLINNLRAM